MEIQDYVRFGRKWLPLALILALVFGAATYVLTSVLVHKQYAATVTMEVQLGLTTSGTTDPNTAAAYAATEAAIANQSNTVNEATVQAARTVPPAESKYGIENVSCYQRGTTTLFSCAVTSRSPEFSAAVANRLAQVFIATENAWQRSRYTKVIQYINKQISKAKQNGNISALQVLQSLSLQTQLASAQQGNLARIVTPATIPYSPVSPHPLLNAAIAFALVLFLTLGLGKLVDAFDDSIQGEYELRALTGLPIIGVIPSVAGLQGKPISRKALVMCDAPQSRVAEAVRATRTGIAFAIAGGQARSLVFCSALSGEGTSTVAINVAIAFAEAGKRVVLLDLDLWHRSVSAVFGSSEVGLADILLKDNADLDGYLVPSGIPNLYILPTGPVPVNPAQLLGSPRMAQVMRQLRNKAELVVIDGPALLAAADAAVVAALADEAILVVRPDRSKRSAIARAQEVLQSARVRIAGVVINSSRNWDTGAHPSAYSYRGKKGVLANDRSASRDEMIEQRRDVAESTSGSGGG